MRVSLKALLSTVTAITLAVGGCAGPGNTGDNQASASDTAPAKNGGSLTYLFTTAPVDMDPSTSQDNNVAMPLWNAWFQYLVKPKVDSADFEPMLATSWQVSPDSKSYVFAINPAAKFSDGSPVRAQDVAFSLQRNVEPEVSLLNAVGKKIASIVATDDRTVTINLKEPWPHLLADLASPNAAIYPQAALTAAGDPKTFFNSKPIGTGPFVLSSVVPNSSYVVSRNPNYWDTATAPHLDKITMNIVTDETARLTAVQGGSAQIAQSPPANQIAALANSAQVRPLTFTAARVDLIVLNTTKPPFDNQGLRQAFSLALNRKAMVDAGLFGNGDVASSFLVPPGTSTFQNPKLALYPTDPGKAEQLVKQSGVPTPIPVNLTVSTGTVQDAILTTAKDALDKIGFKVNAQRKDAASVDNDIIGMQYTAGTTFWGNVSADPSTQPLFAVDPDYCCQAYFTGYRNPALVNTLHDAIGTADRNAAQPLWDQVQKGVADGAFLVPLYYPKLTYVARRDVAGFKANPYGFYDWAAVGYAQ
ncbi:ABC transporter substrate-binding protein [Mycobacterium antarcticum]|uniref:ABC transporter substrate-binding protein n=1 Tax=Mycolicibacterium sp. TUM20984 TaxID=3023368 RepID=UPI0024E0C0ED|nr:ABC transporter substrate-binding protein [Mycolicibacterium sp. TUM20984]